MVYLKGFGDILHEYLDGCVCCESSCGVPSANRARRGFGSMGLARRVCSFYCSGASKVTEFRRRCILPKS